MASRAYTHHTDGRHALSSELSSKGPDPHITWVELRGLEPLTPTLPVWCATSCAIAPEVVPIEATPQLAGLQSR